jgi:hypothetical protein
MKKREWKNVPGQAETEGVILIPFRSSGGEYPGDNTQPPYRHEERLPAGNARIELDDAILDLTNDQTKALWEILDAAIWNAPLEDAEGKR